jgi:hypothetical protein
MILGKGSLAGSLNLRFLLMLSLFTAETPSSQRVLNL